MDKSYLDLIDRCHQAATLATMIAVNASTRIECQKASDPLLENLQKEVYRACQALNEVIKLQHNEVHDNYRYPRFSGDL